MPGPGSAQRFELDLPGGGKLHLQSLDEVELLDASASKYLDDYDFDKLNDRVLLGALLTQQLALYRSQQKLSGMEPEFDAKGRPTGQYINAQVKPAQETAAQSAITKASEQIMALEKALGIDKKTRESSGAQTLQNYLVTLKRAAREFGIHVNERTKKYEAFVMELRTRLRMLDNSDAEDRAYHGITAKSVMDYCRETLAELEQADKDFTKQKGKLWRGRL